MSVRFVIYLAACAMGLKVTANTAVLIPEAKERSYPIAQKLFSIFLQRVEDFL